MKELANCVDKRFVREVLAKIKESFDILTTKPSIHTLRDNRKFEITWELPLAFNIQLGTDKDGKTKFVLFKSKYYIGGSFDGSTAVKAYLVFQNMQSGSIFVPKQRISKFVHKGNDSKKREEKFLDSLLTHQEAQVIAKSFFDKYYAIKRVGFTFNWLSDKIKDASIRKAMERKFRNSNFEYTRLGSTSWTEEFSGNIGMRRATEKVASELTGQRFLNCLMESYKASTIEAIRRMQNKANLILDEALKKTQV